MVEPKNCISYETWVGNLFAHIAKCMEIQHFIWEKNKKKKKTINIMSKGLNTNNLDIL